jgi:hypothetical protein
MPDAEQTRMKTATDQASVLVDTIHVVPANVARKKAMVFYGRIPGK